LIATSIFWFVFAAIIAALEIESEGKYGWAEKMPTWHRTKGPIARLYGKLMNGKPLTGYHTFMFFFPIMLFHAGFFMGVSWTPTAEFKAWTMYFSWCVLWDYLWFVLNPHYGAARFKKENVWWHAKSPWVFGFFPIDYAVGIAGSIGFAYAASALTEHLIMLGIWLILTFASIVFLAPLYRRWYHAMRAGDDK